MDAVQVRRNVALLDTRNSTAGESAWDQLRPLGDAVVPFLLEFYPKCRTWQGRTALLFHATRYARATDAAVELGILALGDRSFMVRYRACGLLAYSLRRDALPPLKLLLPHLDSRTVEDAEAAIDSITNRNHHFFVDRDHSGHVHWIVNESDDG